MSKFTKLFGAIFGGNEPEPPQVQAQPRPDDSIEKLRKEQERMRNLRRRRGFSEAGNILGIGGSSNSSGPRTLVGQ